MSGQAPGLPRYTNRRSLGSTGGGGGGGGDATEATLQQVRDNVQDLENLFSAEDFATETTLEAARALLALIEANIDVALSSRASEATVATLLTEATFAAEDFATQTTLEAARVLLAAIDATLDVNLSTRASESTLLVARNKLASVTPINAEKNTIATHTLHTPAAGQSIRLKWVFLQTPTANSAPVNITLTLDGSQVWSPIQLKADRMFMHSTHIEGGADGTLQMALDAAQTVRFSGEIEEF